MGTDQSSLSSIGVVTMKPPVQIVFGLVLVCVLVTDCLAQSNAHEVVTGTLTPAFKTSVLTTTQENDSKNEVQAMLVKNSKSQAEIQKATYDVLTNHIDYLRKQLKKQKTKNQKIDYKLRQMNKLIKMLVAKQNITTTP